MNFTFGQNLKKHSKHRNRGRGKNMREIHEIEIALYDMLSIYGIVDYEHRYTIETININKNSSINFL